MKKTLSVLLLLSLMFLSFTACSNTGAPTNTPGDTTDGDSGPAPAFVDQIKDYDKVDDSSTEGFVIKSKKYDYEGNNVVILNLENQSENNYTVTVNLTYCDGAGNTLGEDLQSFEGFAANWQKYFVFEPNKPIDSYTYEIALEEYSGECYAVKCSAEFDKLTEIVARVDPADEEKSSVISADCNVSNHNDTDVILRIRFVLIGNTGKIYKITSLGGFVSVTKDIQQSKSMDIYYDKIGELVWPEEIKDGVLGICAVESVTPYG